MLLLLDFPPVLLLCVPPGPLFEPERLTFAPGGGVPIGVLAPPELLAPLAPEFAVPVPGVAFAWLFEGEVARNPYLPVISGGAGSGVWGFVDVALLLEDGVVAACGCCVDGPPPAIRGRTAVADPCRSMVVRRAAVATGVLTTATCTTIECEPLWVVAGTSAIGGNTFALPLRFAAAWRALL